MTTRLRVRSSAPFGISPHQRNNARFHWFAVSLSSLILGIAWLLMAPMMVSAHVDHAEYVSSDPAINAMLTKAPSTVTIHFSENVDPSGSNVTIYDVDGKQVSPAAAQVDNADLKTMTVNLNGNGSDEK